ncbi:MAG TPA: PAS domain S-box protein [Terracidiphilus sp.]|nr:PAS domain S-box protein [Terracidiphilus sp.]
MGLLAQTEWHDPPPGREPEWENTPLLPHLGEAEALLLELASVFAATKNSSSSSGVPSPSEDGASNLEAKYRALLEQIPAVVFMAYLDRGVSEAYVSPEIEASLGYSREEWLEDPVRWYDRIHPDDKQRWSIEAAGMFLSGKPLRSSYRVMARNSSVVWFHCDARMVRHPDGSPWFIHGVAFDISDLKDTERALQQERNVVSAILDTVGALVTVLDPEGRIVRFNRACELTTGFALEEVRGKSIWDFFLHAEEVERARFMFSQLSADLLPQDFQSHWVTRHDTHRLIAWSCSMLPASDGTPSYFIATGIDITEREQLERALLDISAREQRRIGQDLHDGLGQHLTGIAFMAKVHEAKLAEKQLPDTADAAKIVKLVNEAIHKTRVLARGLLPVVSDSQGLMSALQVWAGEVEDLFGISCRFQCENDVLIHDDAMATHLYHIAQEAVNNAIKHGQAKNILIRLSAENVWGTLQINDNGTGIQEVRPSNGGMGLHIMSYRAGMIGGRLEVRASPPRGTCVTCMFPLASAGSKGLADDDEHGF